MADGGVAAEAYIVRVLSLLTFFAKVSRHLLEPSTQA